MALLASASVQAQASVTTEIQAMVEEESLPAVGVRYYYYPNLDSYFDTRENMYLFQENGQWVKAREIKSGYRGYSIFNNVRVAITDYHGDRPYTKLEEHRKQFPKNYSSKRKPQKQKQESHVAFR